MRCHQLVPFHVLEERAMEPRRGRYRPISFVIHTIKKLGDEADLQLLDQLFKQRRKVITEWEFRARCKGLEKRILKRRQHEREI